MAQRDKSDFDLQLHLKVQRAERSHAIKCSSPFFLQNNKLFHSLTNIHNNSICDTSNVVVRPVCNAKCGCNGGGAHGQSAESDWREKVQTRGYYAPNL